MTPRRTRTRDKWAKVYEEKRPMYEAFTMKLYELIKELLRTYNINVAQIEHRTKTVESFKEKLQRGEKSYDDPLVQLTDLSGIRIIAYYLEDVGKIGEMLKNEFVVDVANSVDKAQAADPDRFGYASVHYVISLSPSRRKLTEWKPCTHLKAEIQVRTVLQHAWSVIDHKLRYKAAYEAPRTLRRQLFRLSALLELADSEFSDLRVRSEKLAEQYSEDVSKGEYDIELNMSSLRTYLKSSKQHLEWMKIAEKLGYRIEYDYKDEYVDLKADRVDITLGFLLRILQGSGIETIRDFHALLNEARDWGEDMLKRVLEISSKKGFVPFAVPSDILLFLTIYGKRKIIPFSIVEKVVEPFVEELRSAILEVAGFRRRKSS